MLRVLHFYVYSKLACYSCICHDLEACLLILPVIFGFFWRGLFSDLLFFMPCFLWGLGFTKLWAFLPSAYYFTISLALLSFPVIPFCHSCCNIIWPNPARPFWVCHLFFSQWLSMVIGLSIYITCGFLCPICFFLGILGPFAFLGPFPNFCIPMSFYLTSLGFPGPISLSLVLGAHGLAINPLLSLFVLFLACCGLFSLFYITYCP